MENIRPVYCNGTWLAGDVVENCVRALSITLTIYLGAGSSSYSHAGSSPHERVHECKMERYMACALNMCPYGLQVGG